MKADVLRILKMWYFSSFEGFKSELLAVKVGLNFKNISVTEKEKSKNNENRSLKRIESRANRVVLRCYSFRASNPKIGRVLFFHNASFFLKFDLTWTDNNSGSKPLKLKKYHIFRIVRTSAFTCLFP